MVQLTREGSDEWNEELIKRIFHSNDAEMILTLNAPTKNKKDFLAWHYESNGIFIVRSAYKLAYNIANNNQNMPSSSTTKDSDRKIWGNIWTAPAPNKVRVFGWRLAKDNLPTKMNKLRRTLELDSTCSLCGMEQETSYHATVSCTKARAFRSEMRKFWDLPSEYMFRFTGPDWLPLLLSNIAKEKRGFVLLVLWRPGI
jgi:hypothetical protein